MSILVHVDKDNDDSNMIELKCGQYRYNTDDGTITNMKDNMKIYINHVPLVLTPSWINQFIISPSTKVTLYNVDQSVNSNMYTGDMLVVYNYNTAKSDNIYVNLHEHYEGISMVDSVLYIVISDLDKCRNKHKSKKGKHMFMLKYYNSDVHTRRLRDEPVICINKSRLSTYNFNDVLSVVIIIIIVSIIFYVAFTIAITKNKHSKASYDKLLYA